MGIFGALNEGLTGDISVLLSKTVLDVATAILFSSIVGISIAMISIPQFIILSLIYFTASLIQPFISPEILSNFFATGGIVTIIIGCKMAKMSNMRAINTIHLY